ncbi:MAG: ABC transporter substrate-binding protein [Tepidisphaeraceae bacterium]
MRFAGIVLALGLIVLAHSPLSADPTTAPAPDAPANSAVPATTARALIEAVLADVTVILHNPQLNASQRSEAVRQIAYANIDFQTLSRLTLAQNWRGLSPEKQAEFVQEFQKHLAATYAHTTDNYDNEVLSVAADRKESNGDWTVQTKIVGNQQTDNKPEVIKVDYRLRQKDNQWKVIDVTVDGVSLVANFRSQFQEIMSNGGIEQLLKLLRDKNAQETK